MKDTYITIKYVPTGDHKTLGIIDCFIWSLREKMNKYLLMRINISMLFLTLLIIICWKLHCKNLKYKGNKGDMNKKHRCQWHQGGGDLD